MIVFSLVRLYRRLMARKALGLACVLTLLVIAILGNSICFYAFDRAVDPEITFGTAIWYSVISVTTIGYGDYSAQTLGARLGTIFFIVLVGLTTFSVFFGMIIDWVTELAAQRHRGLGQVMASNHILIVNFPNTDRVERLINELRSDPQHRESEIVIVADQLERLPFSMENVFFVRGSTLHEETYRRASVEQANMAMVLATSYDDPRSDALVASAVSVIDSLKSEIHIVAECVDHDHRHLFKSVRCDAIVSGLRIAGNLLVQEIYDPGVSQVIEEITSNLTETTLYSTEVVGQGNGLAYVDIAKALLDRNINLLCINRGPQAITNYSEVQPHPGDRIVYLARERLTWPRILDLTRVPKA